MIVPSPYGLAGEAFVRSLIADGFLGDLRELHVQAYDRPRRPGNLHGLAANDPLFGVQHADPGDPLRDRAALGGPANRVLAYASK